MKRQHSDQFRHLPPDQQYACLLMLRRLEETQLPAGVNCLAFSVVMQNGHMVTLSKFDVKPDEISVVVSWDKDRQLTQALPL
ncbi:hypothetical protein [Rahnella inusitata]|uniref:hypothetical protein n=1 Tax=Rahnella inusitata TaxID=58169 RepID=UPI0039AF173C